MTPKQARLITKFLPSGYIRLVNEELVKQNQPEASQPFISNVRWGRKQNDRIEAIILKLVRQERSRQERKDRTIKSIIR